MTKSELQFIKELIKALSRKCKTEALYQNTQDGIKIINKELTRSDWELNND